MLVWWLALSFRAFYIVAQTVMLKWFYGWELPVYYYKQYLQACYDSEDEKIKKYLHGNQNLLQISSEMEELRGDRKVRGDSNTPV